MISRILVVDDDKVVCEYIEGALAIEGYQVTSVHGSGDAMEEAPAHDVILLDIDLGAKKNGLQVLADLKKGIYTRDIPVLLFTGHANPELRRLGEKYGAAEYLQKPTTLAQLFSAIRRHLPRESYNSRIDKLESQFHGLLDQTITIARESVAEATETGLKLRGAIASLLTDNIQGPIGLIQAILANLLRNGETSPKELEKALLAIRTEMDYISGQVQQIAQATERNKTVAAVDINRLVLARVETCQPLALKKKITLSATIDPEPQIIQSVQQDIDFILFMLMLNAGDALQQMEQGKLRESNVTAWHREGRIFIDVYDNGPGLNSEHEPFTNPAPGRLGLGLLQSKKLAKALGGDVSQVEKHLGGTLFRLSLPANK